jgi:DNA-binding NtrC family response regulator
MRIGRPCEGKVGGLGRFSFSLSAKIERHPLMEQSVEVNRIAVSALPLDPRERLESSEDLPIVLVATTDTAIANSMRELLQMFPLKTIWAKSVDEVRVLIGKEHVAACFCGFWLVDGTYRDVVRLLKRRPVEIPAIIVCTPACPHEYRDYLASLNIRAFDFICHPYRKSDLERILRAAISKRSHTAGVQSWPEGESGFDGLTRTF